MWPHYKPCFTKKALNISASYWYTQKSPKEIVHGQDSLDIEGLKGHLSRRLQYR